MKKSYDKKNNQHYDKVAIKQKKSKLSTMEDEYVRDQETDFIINIIKNDKKKLNILDIGCGNGYTLAQITRLSKNFLIHGMDNNDSLYEIAHKRLTDKEFKYVFEDCDSGHKSETDYRMIIIEK